MPHRKASEMHCLVQLDVTRRGPFADRLREGIASLQGAARAFMMDGVAYNVVNPRTVQVTVGGASLPKEYKRLLAQVTLSDVVLASRDIGGGYRKRRTSAMVRPGNPNHSIVVTAPSLNEVMDLYNLIVHGDASRYLIGQD